MNPHGRISPGGAHKLDDPRRLETQVSGEDLVRLLALRGDEDIVDLGSGTGFYTDRMAALTTGTVYAVELQPEMIDRHRQRGAPGNVRLIQGDITALELEPSSVDVACSIATWHEVDGRLDLPGLARAMRRQGRLVVIDWRKDPESGESGPPVELRSNQEEVARALAPYFIPTWSEDLGRFMFAVVAARAEPALR